MTLVNSTAALIRVVAATAVILVLAVISPAMAQGDSSASASPAPSQSDRPAGLVEALENSQDTGMLSGRHFEAPLGDDPDIAALVIPVVAILMVFGAPVVGVLLLAYFILRHRERRRRMQGEDIQRFLDAGKDVPPEILAPQSSLSPPAQHLNQGILLLAAGVGLTLFLTLLLGFTLGSAGLVLIAMGVAKIVIWKLDQRSTGRSI